MLRVAFAGLVGGAMALLAADGRASLHHPEDRTADVPVGETGTPTALPFDEFARRRLILRNVGNSTWPLVWLDPKTKEPLLDPKTGRPRPTERGAVDARIKRAQQKRARDRTPPESAALATDLLWFGRPDAAEGEIPAEQRRTFLPNVTLAHVAAAQGQWSRARNFLDIANELADDKHNPVAVPGTAPKQLAWQLKLNKGPLAALFRLRAREARDRDDEAAGAKGERNPALSPENERPDHIFDVDFAKMYEPGAAGEAERAKLPPDALATAQQLVLWFPYDWRLYWLLGEVYAAKGEVRAAKKIMDECVYSGSYSNRKALMQHREAVAKAVAALPPEPQPPEHSPPPEVTETEPAVPFTMTAVWWYFGAVGLFGLLALLRAVWKRGKRTST